MKIVVLGANGQLGKEFVESFSSDNLFQSYFLEKNECNIVNFDQLSVKIKKINPSFIINCAAYTNVDGAETNKEAANDVNLKAVENIIKICNLLDITLIHFSTDYVFDGNSLKPILEDNAKKPINYYGKTKHLGEEIIINKMRKYFIFRISWVYGLHGSNFPKTIIELTKTKTNLSVINDQIGCPTPTFLIVNVIKLILRDKELNKKYGIYNLAPLGSTSWYEIAYQIYEYFSDNPKCKLENIEPVKSTSYITKAKRPKYSVLDNNKIIQNFNLSFRQWDLYLKEFLSNISY